MPLTLRIENMPVLPDGGPLSVTTDGAKITVGRNGTLRLPDPTNWVSRQHCEIWKEGGEWFLLDTSSHGTFRVGQDRRVPAPCPVAHGDRFAIGHYIIVAEITDPAPRTGTGGGAGWGAPPPDDPWGGGEGGSARGSGGGARGPLPWESEPAGGSGGGARPPGNPWDTDGDGPGAVWGGGAPGTPAPVRPPGPGGEAGRPAPPQPGPGPGAGTGAGTGAGGDWIAAFCRGAGLPPGALAARPPEALAEEAGRALRIVAEQLALLLQNRSEAKLFLRGGERTMVGARDNNPLKFARSPTEALQAMLAGEGDAYLRAERALSEGFADLAQHQVASLAALQPALRRLLEPLDPATIEANAESGLLTSPKAAAWEAYVRQWDRMAEGHDNGLLDVFLALYAEAYDAALRARPGRGRAD